MNSANKVTIIVNPIAGVGAGSSVERGKNRAELATAFLAKYQQPGQVLVTKGQGHAKQLAQLALDEEHSTVIVAWGGDGTVNEIASVLTGSLASLVIVPDGSGNGLASELGIPKKPEHALELALSGKDRWIDVGELDGRPFVNIAGIGLDAKIAHRFSLKSQGSRGFAGYLSATAREVFHRVSNEYRIAMPFTTVNTQALLIAIANGCQYGNGAVIAPCASLDDGQFDVMVVEDRPLFLVLAALPYMFTRRIDRVSGVHTYRTDRLKINGSGPVHCHVDGEPFVGSSVVTASIHAAALKVRC